MEDPPPVSIFGIRHHGPGSARSLLAALSELEPDCVLIEGPAGAEKLLEFATTEGMRPPVALLTYSTAEPERAAFHPYADFSPEWQAIQWAAHAAVPVEFIDLPPSYRLSDPGDDSTGEPADDPEGSAENLEGENSAGAGPEGENSAGAGPEGADPEGAGPDGENPSGENPGGADPNGADPGGEDYQGADLDGEDEPLIAGAAPLPDPLEQLAQAAGYPDGEAWWNFLVEERGNELDVFDAISEAMHAVREESPPPPQSDLLREAHMRLALRAATKKHQRIAVVVGAWHVPALGPPALKAHTATADRALLRGLTKTKTETAWVPWTYRHLSRGSGYGAGLPYPGWSAFLWQHQGRAAERAPAWFARVARLLREKELDCSSAHLIEATRLADAMAALRGRPAPTLDEINDATLAVLLAGEPTPMRLIADELLIGNDVGNTPESAPMAPLQRDVLAEQKRLRLKPEAGTKIVNLDLRKDNDRGRSLLLHRLRLLGVGWGELGDAGTNRGTFRETWELQWDPRLSVDLVLASRYGQTVPSAAANRTQERARNAVDLAELSVLIEEVLLADLPEAVSTVGEELGNRAAQTEDAWKLLAALPPLAGIHRYGDVRQTDTQLVAQLFDSLLIRGSAGLVVAAADLAEEPAESAREVLLQAAVAVTSREEADLTLVWQQALLATANAPTTSPLLRGVATRLLHDAGVLSTAEVEQRLGSNLSVGAELLEAAQWLTGFLNSNATVLLHADSLWSLLDAWLQGLPPERFLTIVPTLRRTFTRFSTPDRRDLGFRAKSGRPPQAEELEWDWERASRAATTIRELFGLEAQPQEVA